MKQVDIFVRLTRGLNGPEAAPENLRAIEILPKAVDLTDLLVGGMGVVHLLENRQNMGDARAENNHVIWSLPPFEMNR